MVSAGVKVLYVFNEVEGMRANYQQLFERVAGMKCTGKADCQHCVNLKEFEAAYAAQADFFNSLPAHATQRQHYNVDGWLYRFIKQYGPRQTWTDRDLNESEHSRANLQVLSKLLLNGFVKSDDSWNYYWTPKARRELKGFIKSGK